LRVLLIEDDPDLAEATTAFLEAEGLDVRTVLSGREALETASAFQPELVLCDLSLPDMHGMEVIRELRSNRLAPRTYVVILTARRMTEPKPADVDAFIMKPLTTESVHALVNAARSAHS
jgi:two-component system response regulator MprA